MKKSLVFGVLMLFAIAGIAQSNSWKVDTAKATIKFVTSGPFGEVDGSLGGIKAVIVFDSNKAESGSMVVTLDPNTISTGVSLRNTHLREKEEFFNTAKYPLITFKSKQIKKAASGYTVTGDLTIKTITKQIIIPFTFTRTSTGAIFKGQFTMDSYDYTVNDSSKKVTVYIEVSVIKQ
jgi:polyisoprenoid-binding protein YceI